MVLPRFFTILFTLAGLLIPCGVEASQSVNLTWQANPPGEDVAGYRVYFGTNSGNYTQTQEASVPSSTVSGLTEGVIYYFAVTAFNSQGVEGPYS
ncbi:MAG: fibronectin type III domain-containing protein, partial [Chthoniobacterales bacterium]